MSTEKTYTFWIKHYIFFHNKKHPAEMGKPEIEGFLTNPAVEKKVSPSTHVVAEMNKGKVVSPLDI